MKRSARLLLVSSFVVCLPLYAAPPCETTRTEVAQAFPCGVIAVGASAETVVTIGRGAGASVKYEFARWNAAALTVPGRPALQALRASLLRLYPDRRVQAHVVPDAKGGKPGGGGTAAQVTPDGVTRVGGPATGAASVAVAIADTGIDLANQDLNVGSASFDAHGGNGQDQNGHGTHVAGIVAAINNTIGVVGVVPGTTVHSVRVLDASGSGSDSDVTDGLRWVLDNHASTGIRVVNMSLGREGTVNDQPTLHTAVIDLVNAGVAVVVSAGNDPNKQIDQMVPAGYPEVMAVASTTAIGGTNQCSRLAAPIPADTASYFTTDGTGVAVSAPGATRENVNKPCFISSEGILSLKVGGGTTRMSGTSMAAPHVAGIVAAMIGGKTVSQVRNCLSTNADRKAVAPLDSPASSYSPDGTREGIAKLGGCP